MPRKPLQPVRHRSGAGKDRPSEWRNGPLPPVKQTHARHSICQEDGKRAGVYHEWLEAVHWRTTVFDLSVPKLLVLAVLVVVIFGPGVLGRIAGQANRTLRGPQWGQ